jgi:trans-aconitate methyltransferase
MNTKTVNYAPMAPVPHWDAKLYDSHHSFVSNLAVDLLELLDPRAGEHILDLGCGTGHLSYKITNTGAEVIGIDKASTQIKRANQNYPNLNFGVADGSNLVWTEQFDAVFSNAVLHWIQQPEKVIAGVWRALKPGGRFVAEFGGKGNVDTIITAIYAALDAAGYPENKTLNPWYFPSISEYGTLLEATGFQLKLATLMERPTPLNEAEKGLRHWLRMFAGNFFQGIPASEQLHIITDIETHLRPKLFKNGTWIADYKRIRIVATKIKD